MQSYVPYKINPQKSLYTSETDSINYETLFYILTIAKSQSF